MNQDQSLDTIRQAIADGQISRALSLVEEHGQRFGPSASLYCLEGKAHLRLSDWRKAQNAFLRAEELEPQGAATQYLAMLRDIMNFFNKDMYNQ